MNGHPDDAALQRHIDGELPVASRWELEAHLRVCQPCRVRTRELRGLLDALAGLPREIAPPHDLWSAIAGKLEEAPVISVAPRFQTAKPRARLLVPLGWTAAIAAALVLGLALGRQLPRPALETVLIEPTTVSPRAGVVAASEEPTAVVPVAGQPAVASQPLVAGSPAADPADPVLLASFGEPSYDVAVADLQSVLDGMREQLRPETVAALEENLAIIDMAILEAREALLADPANLHLHRHLASSLQTKLRLLRMVTSASSADI